MNIIFTGFIILHYILSLGGTPYVKVEDACQKIWIKSLKETNLGLAQVLFDPLKDIT